MEASTSSFLHTWADASSTLQFVHSVLQLGQSMLKRVSKMHGRHAKRKGSMEEDLIDDPGDRNSYG